jgi:hypothetical protein
VVVYSLYDTVVKKLGGCEVVPGPDKIHVDYYLPPFSSTVCALYKSVYIFIHHDFRVHGQERK